MLSRSAARPALRLPLLRAAPFASKPSGKDPEATAHSAAEYGHKHADEGSGSQIMHDAGAGKYAYIQDFANSMTEKKVKLSFTEKPMSEKERRAFEQNEANLKMVQRSMVIGSVCAFLGVGVGWFLTKRALGVSDAKEFSAKMHDKMPKVSDNMQSTKIGAMLQERSYESRDAISESEELTAFRRSLRDKFNSEEGKQLARANSIILAGQRAKERIERAATKEAKAKAAAVDAGATAEHAPVEAEMHRLVRRASAVLVAAQNAPSPSSDAMVVAAAEEVAAKARRLDDIAAKVAPTPTVKGKKPPPAAEEAPPPA